MNRTMVVQQLECRFHKKIKPTLTNGFDYILNLWQNQEKKMIDISQKSTKKLAIIVCNVTIIPKRKSSQAIKSCKIYSKQKLNFVLPKSKNLSNLQKQERSVTDQLTKNGICHILNCIDNSHPLCQQTACEKATFGRVLCTT